MHIKRSANTMKSAPVTFLIVVLLAGCNPFARFGPLNPPRFHSMKWNRMEANYSIKLTSKRTIERRLVIDDEKRVRDGLAKLKNGRTRVSWLPSSGEMKLYTEDGEAWDLDVVFEDRIDFGLRPDLNYSYHVFTNDYEFFHWLEHVCLEDARRDFPSATYRNIILRRNLALECYEPLFK
jgi:hypothetical protein